MKVSDTSRCFQNGLILVGPESELTSTYKALQKQVGIRFKLHRLEKIDKSSSSSKNDILTTKVRKCFESKDCFMYSGHGDGAKFYANTLYSLSNKNCFDWLEKMKSVDRNELGVR